MSSGASISPASHVAAIDFSKSSVFPWLRHHLRIPIAQTFPIAQCQTIVRLYVFPREMGVQRHWASARFQRWVHLLPRSNFEVASCYYFELTSYLLRHRLCTEGAMAGLRRVVQMCSNHLAEEMSTLINPFQDSWFQSVCVSICCLGFCTEHPPRESCQWNATLGSCPGSSCRSAAKAAEPEAASKSNGGVSVSQP